MKLVVWEENSREVLRGFPESVRRDLGTGLMLLQVGEVPTDAKPFKQGCPAHGSCVLGTLLVITEQFTFV